ncbi:hypothetical protein IHE55_17335 [Streptomyces pactum]|uniref:HNH endonuclease n=1 Tax=Streptomyces pactum TaxID=68249 RepID=A0ABS0NMK9_9ACTN|nr:hypothetical protein [Streptomyces pactum]MBH5336445.1 hypothetical protein [Streptomyces pactum]
MTGLQRTAGNAAVTRLLAAGHGLLAGRRTAGAVPRAVVQRAPLRGQDVRRNARRQAANDSPYSGRPRSNRLQEQQGYDPAGARPPQLPSRGPNGERLWDGTRTSIGFTDETVQGVLAATPSRQANGRTEYACAKCGTHIPRKRDRVPATDGDRYVTIDHVMGIIAYVRTNAEPVTWEVHDRQVSAITQEEARRCANDAENLRVLCAQPCNGGTRAARSESRMVDTDRAVWWGG